MLTELLEKRSSFWDVLNKDSLKRDIKDEAYKEIVHVLGCNITPINKKINGLRVQYSCKKEKMNKTKRGEITDKFYVSNWTHSGI